MVYQYNKLVRDKIVENIKSKGHQCQYRQLDDQEFLAELDKKLMEETKEVMEAHSAEEIGDLLEVIIAIMREYNISDEQIKKAMKQKQEKNGVFHNRVFLISVEEKDKERE